MNKVNRYNQGFGKFGPMEQCKDGKWVSAEDYLPIVKTLENTKQQLEAIIFSEDWYKQSYEGCYNVNLDRLTTIYKLKKVRLWYKIGLVISVSINISLIAVIMWFVAEKLV